MMDHILAGVEELVAQEHKAIVTKHGDGYNSAHEAYAVLLEEVQEAEEALAYVKCQLDNLWDYIRRDDDKLIGTNVLRTEHYAKELAAEAVQVAAVCRRARCVRHE